MNLLNEYTFWIIIVGAALLVLSATASLMQPFPALRWLSYGAVRKIRYGC